MAGQEDLLTQLAAVLAAFDEAALEALASRGLLRRAQKDFEAGAVAGVEEAEGAVVVRVADARVTMPAQGPKAARCTCPATSACRHVLAATLHLKGWLAGRASSTAGPSGRDELLRLTVENLRRWAGTKALREALGLVAEGLAVVASEEGTVSLYLPSFGVECRYVPGTGLDGVLTNAPTRDRAKLVTAAILAYQKANGVVLDLDGFRPKLLEEAPGAPRSRAELVAAAGGLAEEMVRAGLAHLSPAFAERLTTLGVSATGGNLPRLAAGLRSLADEVTSQVARTAQADADRLFVTAARVYALTTALAGQGDSPAPELVGRHRTHYHAVAQLELVGAGAYPWRSRSGYDGLTVLLWDERGKQWFSWSDSRPRVHAAGFDPRRRYHQVGPWEDGPLPADLAGRRCKLIGARANAQNRLSSTGQCRAILGGATCPEQVDFGLRKFTAWAALRAYAAQGHAVGLQEPRLLDQAVVLQPTTWAARGFDAVAQTFRWFLLDADEAALPLEVPYNELTQPAIALLERLDPAAEGVWGLLGQVVVRPGGLVVVPWTLYRDEREGRSAVLNVMLDHDAPPTADAPTAAAEADEPPDLDAEGDETYQPLPAGLERELSGLEDDLLRHAESGSWALAELRKERLSDRARRLRERGLELLAAAAGRFAEDGTPASLLRARYVTLLHRQLAAPVLATAPHP